MSTDWHWAPENLSNNNDLGMITHYHRKPLAFPKPSSGNSDSNSRWESRAGKTRPGQILYPPLFACEDNFQDERIFYLFFSSLQRSSSRVLGERGVIATSRRSQILPKCNLSALVLHNLLECLKKVLFKASCFSILEVFVLVEQLWSCLTCLCKEQSHKLQRFWIVQGIHWE